MTTRHQQRPDTDVVVVGAGNAGLLAAIAASEAGASVLLIEASAPEARGGNSRFASGVYRIAHNGVDDLRKLVPGDQDLPWDRYEIAPYSAARFLQDIVGPSRGFADTELASVVVDRSLETVQWMRDNGVRWNLASTKLPQNLREGEVVRLNPGGELIADGNGRTLVESLFARVAQLGVEVRYRQSAVALVARGRTVEGVVLRSDSGDETIRAGATILACGGFESSPEARRRYLGQGWDLVKVRGTAFNTGVMLDRAIELGAATAGHWGGAHGVPIDADAPASGDLELGDATARYSYPYGITVNLDGRRFLDEGRDEMPFTYAEVGQRILSEPGATAYQIFDAEGTELLEPRYASGSVYEARTLAQLAAATGLPSEELIRTVDGFNAACASETIDPAVKDGVAAHPEGQPPKSNWAAPLVKPPFRAYRVSCGITFTFGGLAVDGLSRVLGPDRAPLPGLLAAGEIAGGFFAFNVPSGSGLTKGAVTARIAGHQAAEIARQRR